MREQARRCMDCGVPFCHTGCPLGNLIPDWNDLVERGRWREAHEQLDATNNFPEFTGKLCPAPCEEACVLTLNDDAVTIKQVEMAIADRALRGGLGGAAAAGRARAGDSVAVVGSGPGRAGRGAAAAARRARRDGARARRPAGRAAALRHPRLQDREGAGRPPHRAAGGRGRRVPLRRDGRPTPPRCAPRYDAVVLATGAQRHRDLDLPGRELDGHRARDAVPDRLQPARGGRALAGGGRIVRRPGSPRGDPGRRRHQRRLPRLGPPRGLRVGGRGRARHRAADRALAARDLAGAGRA